MRVKDPEAVYQLVKLAQENRALQERVRLLEEALGNLIVEVRGAKTRVG